MQDNHENSEGFLGNKTMEIVNCLILLAFGGLVMWDTYRIGAGWGVDGPETGAFPFYCGLFIVISAFVTLIGAFRKSAEEMGSFVNKEEIRMVMAMLIPSIVYVVAVLFIGLYVASAIFITFFMIWQGKFSIVKSLSVAIPVNVFFFFMFEIWFKIPLPKGPVERMLGF